MTEKIAVKNRIVLGDRVPRFSAPLITGGSFDLHVSAGRWVVLSFLGSPSNPQANVELANLLREADLFREDHLVVGCVFTEPPGDIAKIAEISGNALFFLADYDGAISRSFGALAMPRTIVLDPMLRAVADIAWDFAQGHAEAVRGVLRNLPTVDDSAGVPMSAPALIVPRIFSFELCDFLMQFRLSI
jgi:peroxiredoxin